MAMFGGLPQPPSHPSDRYTRTNPLRREGGLRLLTGNLPEPLRWAIIAAWRRPNPFPNAAYAPELPSPRRQRPHPSSLFGKPPRILGYLALIELELARRLVEAPQASMAPALRNTMLFEAGLYLGQVYLALAEQIGEPAALAEFKRLLPEVG